MLFQLEPLSLTDELVRPGSITLILFRIDRFLNSSGNLMCASTCSGSVADQAEKGKLSKWRSFSNRYIVQSMATANLLVFQKLSLLTAIGWRCLSVRPMSKNCSFSASSSPSSRVRRFLFCLLGPWGALITFLGISILWRRAIKQTRLFSQIFADACWYLPN